MYRKALNSTFYKKICYYETASNRKKTTSHKDKILVTRTATEQLMSDAIALQESVRLSQHLFYVLHMKPGLQQNKCCSKIHQLRGLGSAVSSPAGPSGAWPTSDYMAISG